MRPFVRLVLAVLTLCSIAAPARATIVVVPTFDEMAIASEVIAYARVVDQRTMREQNRTMTYTTLEVKDGWKGVKTGARLDVVQVGGEWDGKSAWIVGAHRFHKDDELVFFGMRNRFRGNNIVMPYGVGFGLFDVVDDLTGPKVIESIGDVATPEGRKPEVRRYDSLAAFKETVHEALLLHELPHLPRKQVLGPHLPTSGVSTHKKGGVR